MYPNVQRPTKRVPKVQRALGTRPRNSCRAIWTLVSAVAFVAASASGATVNEILYYENPGDADPLRDHEWAEVHNEDIAGIDLTGWVISDEDGATGGGARTLPGVILPPDAYLVVHFSAGTDDLDFSDGCGEYYTGDAPGVDVFDDDMDECALYSDTGIVDFISWKRGDSGYIPGTAHDDAVAAGQWTQGDFLNTARIQNSPREKFRSVMPGSSIGRDKNSTDIHEPYDWDANGGRHAGDITLCRQNLNFFHGVAFAAGVAPPQKDWTVMIYISADHGAGPDGIVGTQDDGNLEPFAYKDLKEIEEAGGSDADVNVVVMVDGNQLLRQGTVDAQNNLISVPGTLGGTWRFQVGGEVDERYVRLITHGGDNPFLGSPSPSTPPDVNMGDPGSLAAFITWAKSRYPAQKYALVLWDHGLGWKGFGWDDTFEGQHEDSDALFMGELSVGLAGHSFELIGFDACLMAMIEVAYQVEPYSNYMVASQELEAGDGWPYDVWLPGLKANPGWDGGQLGEQIVSDFHAFYNHVPDPALPDETRDNSHTLSCVDQSQLPALVTSVSTFANDLRTGCDDFKIHDDPLDNVEHRIALDAAITERFGDNNYMDLHHFATVICNDAGVPIDCTQCGGTPVGCTCYKPELATLVPLSKRDGPVVIAELHGDEHGNAHGLSIYMPLKRTADDPDESGYGDDVYDYPYASRVSDGDTQRAMYAENDDCLPILARDVETGQALPAPAQWPLVATPDFRFPVDTLWDEFLQRFYHPVADNHILRAECPTGTTVYPKVNDPECGNPVDEITISPGCTVFFSAQGSSDADTPNKLPLHWMWDFDHTANGCGACIAPYEVPAGADAASADDDMNAEHDCDKTPLNDEKEADADGSSPNSIVSRTYTQLGDYIVTLNVWDDNHTFSFHDTIPSAQYVHTQTDDHVSVVHVVQTGVSCDGTESGGTGVTSCPGTDPRDYAYPLTAGAVNPVTSFSVGTDDCNPANYTNICMPPGWTFAIVQTTEEHDKTKTPHGGATGAPTGACPCVVSFTMGAGAPIPPLEAFTFGFNNSWVSHDVGWDASGTVETWGAPSGDGVGPVHGPWEPGPCNDPCVKGPHWVDYTCAGLDVIPVHGALIGIDLDFDPYCVPDTTLRLSACGEPALPQLVNRSKPYPGDPVGDPGHRNQIDTELVDLCLTDGTVTMWAGAGNQQGNSGVLGASLGMITEQPGNFTLADSYFDMFFEIYTGDEYLYNYTALRMSANGDDAINCVPPTGNSYFHPCACLPLYNNLDRADGQVVARLVMAQHWVAPASPPVGACCFHHCEGCECTLLTERVCECIKNAIYYGDGSTCEPVNPCDIDGPPVPSVTGWGLVVVTLLVVAAGSIMLRHRRRLAA